MANEYLTRTPTSTGNRRVFTWSTWVKRNSLTSTNQNLLCSTEPALISKLFFNTNDKLDYQNNSPSFELITSQTFRDVGNWFHILFVAETTASISSERIRIYVNGTRITKFDTETYPSINSTLIFNYPIPHFISKETSSTNWFIGEFADVFFIDGQALTPDVFGFYKQGKGYISAGSTQATDFRPGQWVPKTPRVIKTEINRRGGFGVNGFYLPMNDSKNFGADFHCDPNSIITLNEKLPQPRVGVATTASVGLGYTDALRADPYAANLVLALPFVSGGLSSGFGDYAPSIKGSGSAKTITNSGISIVSTASYYGSAASFNGTNGYIEFSGSDFNFGTDDFTVEMWVNSTTGNGTRRNLYWGGNANGSDITGNLFLEINVSNQLRFGVATNGSYEFPSGGSISLNQWNHIAAVKRRTIVTGYLNGVAVGVDTNSTGTVNTNTNPVQIGGVRLGNLFGGYIQDLRIYKGVAKYTGGFDVSRPYTPVGIATWRAVPDTPANNFATLNPLITRVASGTAYSLNFTDGNLTATANSTADSGSICGIAVISGKWYAEYRINTNNTSGSYKFSISVNPDNKHWGIGNGGDLTGSIHFRPSNAQLSSVSGLTFSTIYTLNYTIAIGDIIGVSLDMDNRQVSFYKNGTLITQSGGAAAFPYSFSGTNSTSPYGFGLDIQGTGANQLTTNFGQNPTFSGNTTAGTFTDSNGKGLFKYQPPSGFLALCEDNLPTPAISDPGKHFKTVLYTGDGNSGRSIVGVGFTPDLVWYKARNSAYGHGLFDSIRGALRLSSDGTGAENTDQGVISFNSDGFSLGNHVSGNGSGTTYAAWCWRAGAGTTSTNTNGSITSVVSVNQDAGFSIVSYTGNNTSGATVGHGLGKAPAFIIIKARTAITPAGNWIVLHKGNTPISSYSNSSTFTLSGYNNVTLLNSTLAQLNYSFDAQVNGASPNTYIAYCWAEIEGYSKFSSYVGNGNADGPFVYCGFKPAFVLFKRTDSISNWLIFDSSRNSTNPTLVYLSPNTTDIEFSSGGDMDFLSNGFKLRNTASSLNASGGAIIFAAFAESPFAYSNSK